MNKKGKLEMCWQQTRGQSCVDGDASRTRVLLCLDLSPRGTTTRANEEAAGLTSYGEGGVEAADEETGEQMSEEGRGSKIFILL